VPELPQTIAEAARWLRNGQITSQSLTENLLARCHATQDTLAAFNVISDETALAAARQADQDFAAGRNLGPLQGIPLGIKDLLATADAPTTAHSRVLDPNWGKRQDATVVGKLRRAGAVIMGKLGLSEYAIGWPDPATGFATPKNPWNLERFPGGSSSGTGTAVAAGLILGGLGTDTGGSIRSPSAFCGISGIKPTFGRVSKEGCVPLSYSLDHIGPMAHTAYDCALLLQEMAGYDPTDPSTVNLPVPNMLEKLNLEPAKLRIGLLHDYFFTAENLTQEVKATVLAAIETFRQAGASVTEVTIPHAREGHMAQRIIMLTEAYTYHEPDLQARPQLYGKYTRRYLYQGAVYTAADYIQAQRVRSLVKAECAALLEKVDVLIMPSTTVTAPVFATHDPDSGWDSPSMAAIWNLTGFPAMSVCCGFSNEALPIGMQIIAAPFNEPLVLGVAHAYQQLTDWHLRRPPVSIG